jgi:hypothetical protein
LHVDFSSDFAPRRAEVTQMVFEDELFGPLLGTQTRGPERADRAVLEPAQRSRLATLLRFPADQLGQPSQVATPIKRGTVAAAFGPAAT